MAQELRLVPRDPNYINPYRHVGHKEVSQFHLGSFFIFELDKAWKKWCNMTNIRDSHSYEHYWTSSWNKTWKKFRPVWDLNPWPLQYWCSIPPTELTSQLPEFFFQVLFQLPVGLLAQLVECCTSTAEVMGSNTVWAWIFFRSSFNY